MHIWLNLKVRIHFPHNKANGHEQVSQSERLRTENVATNTGIEES